MHHLRLRRRTALAMTAAFAIPAPAALGKAEWPSRPVKLVVPFPPGGGTDVLARMLSERLRALLGQPIVVENRPGASGNLGANTVAKSGDDHTVLLHGTIIGMYPHIFPKLPYDPLKDLVAVGGVGETPTVVTVNATSPLATMQDLVKSAKADPSKPLQYGSAGVGTPQHLAAELMARNGGFTLQHIAYRGTTPAATDLMANQIQFGAFSLSSVLPLIEGRKLRALSILSERRSSLLPDVPSGPETGFGGIDSTVRFVLFMPSGTPPEIVSTLEAANAKALADPMLKQEFQRAGYEVLNTTARQTAAAVQREHTTWGPLVKELGLKLE